MKKFRVLAHLKTAWVSPIPYVVEAESEEEAMDKIHKMIFDTLNKYDPNHMRGRDYKVRMEVKEI